jgi:hypothetical protein
MLCSGKIVEAAEAVNFDHLLPHLHCLGVSGMAADSLRPTCHPDRKLYAKGRCNSCYRLWRLSQKTERAICHPDRPHVAKGLCRNCYKAHLMRLKTPAQRSAIWRAADLKRTFGITLAQFYQKVAEQGGKCGLCKKPFGKTRGTRPNVDHCHRTGRIRLLLCFKCNVTVGYVETNLAAVQAYLARWAS